MRREIDNQIVICRYCHQPEYWGDMHWLSGKELCRKCYKSEYEKTYREPYVWTDLDGPVPDQADYYKQEASRKLEAFA